MGLETKVEGTAAKPSGHGDGSVSIGLHVQVLLGGMNKTQKWVRKGYRKGHGKGDRKGYRKVLFSFFFSPFLVQNKELQSGRIFWRHHRPSGFVSPAQLCPVSGCWPWGTAGGLGADSDRRSEVAAGSSCTGAAPCIASCPRILVQN